MCLPVLCTLCCAVSAHCCCRCRVPLEQAVGRVCCELLCPYPPGVPVLLPGELITAAAVCVLQQALACGGMVTGAADASLETVLVALAP